MARSRTAGAAPRLPAALTALDTVELDDETELDGVEVRGVTFAREEPTDVEITASRLVGVALTGATFERLRLVDVVLEDCELSGVSLLAARLERVELRGCRASGLVAPALVARGLRALDCRLDQAFLVDATIEGSVFGDCDLRAADLSGAKLTGSRFLRCDLSGADVRRVRAAGVSLHGSRLDQLRGADALRGAVIGSDQIVDLALSVFAALGVSVADPGPDPGGERNDTAP
jgi:uncharacterized protein YjbI with pentapeptide repeats